MIDITLVTGNPNKLRELTSIASNKVNLSSKDLDLPEIQSLDLQTIVEDKVRRAYEIVKKPVLVEDVSAGLDDLGGLPGPFYKFFREKMGDTVLLKLRAVANNDKATIQCLAAYYDGKTILYGEGVIQGIVVEPRGKNGFGFDPIIIPKGQNRTLAEMEPKEKHKISHRGKAFKSLFEQLEALT